MFRSVAGGIDQVQTIVDTAGTVVTSGAVLIGGCWAYFKFVRGRTYRPRLEVTMGAEWRRVAGERALQARVTVKNIGMSVVRLRQEGTGLRVSRLAALPAAPSLASWETLKVFPLLLEHEWIESSESVTEDLLLSLTVPVEQPVLLETRLVWTWAASEAKAKAKADADEAAVDYANTEANPIGEVSPAAAAAAKRQTREKRAVAIAPYRRKRRRPIVFFARQVVPSDAKLPSP
jgi:hypothetical protein